MSSADLTVYSRIGYSLISIWLYPTTQTEAETQTQTEG